VQRFKNSQKYQAFFTCVQSCSIVLSLEWGARFGKPIERRLRAQYPRVTDAEASTLGAWCAEVSSYAFALVEK